LSDNSDIKYKAQQAKQTYQMALAKMETEKEKELNEKKLSFFTHVSHEFRAPLTLIINPVKELLRNPGKAPDPEELHIVYRNARRLLSLVDQLLLFRKADSEVGELKMASVNFCELCQEVYAYFLQQAKAHSIQYELSGVNASFEIFADREKMEIVLFNLISNAFKFTPDGGKIILEILQQVPAAVSTKMPAPGYLKSFTRPKKATIPAVQVLVLVCTWLNNL
jgi:signal transduction histidine kinase